MYRTLCAALLLFASLAFAQQQPARPDVPPPYTTPPTFPQDRQASPRSPADAPTPQQDEKAAKGDSAEVAKQLKQQFANDPLLKEAKIKVKVDNDNITLSGTVNNEQEHQMALQAANANKGSRQIVDKIKIRG